MLFKRTDKTYLGSSGYELIMPKRNTESKPGSCEFTDLVVEEVIRSTSLQGTLGLENNKDSLNEIREFIHRSRSMKNCVRFNPYLTQKGYFRPDVITDFVYRLIVPNKAFDISRSMIKETAVIFVEFDKDPGTDSIMFEIELTPLLRLILHDIKKKYGNVESECTDSV